MSALIILPFGPVPLTEPKFTPWAFAIFLAKGLTNYLSPEGLENPPLGGAGEGVAA